MQNVLPRHTLEGHVVLMRRIDAISSGLADKRDTLPLNR